MFCVALALNAGGAFVGALVATVLVLGVYAGVRYFPAIRKKLEQAWD